MDASNNGIDLGGISHPKGSCHTENAVKPRKKTEFGRKTPANHIHRATHILPAPGYPIPAGKGHLSKFGCHPQKAADPHPEYRPRAAQADCPGDPHDIPGSHRCRQSGAKGLEGGNSLPLGLFTQDFWGSAQQRQLGEAGSYCEERPRCQQKRSPRRAPEYIMDKQKCSRGNTPLE